jgi:hypothetical protein
VNDSGSAEYLVPGASVSADEEEDSDGSNNNNNNPAGNSLERTGPLQHREVVALQKVIAI